MGDTLAAMAMPVSRHRLLHVSSNLAAEVSTFPASNVHRY